MPMVDLSKIPVFGAETPFFPKVEFRATVLLVNFRFKASDTGAPAFYVDLKVVESSHPEVRPGQLHTVYYGGKDDNGRRAAFSRLSRLLATIGGIQAEDTQGTNRVQDMLLAATAAGKLEAAGIKLHQTRERSARKDKNKNPMVNPDGTPVFVYNDSFYKPAAAA